MTPGGWLCIECRASAGGDNPRQAYNSRGLCNGCGKTAVHVRYVPAFTPTHRYVPDYQAMGDCRVCGHVPEADIHATEAAPQSAFDADRRGQLSMF